MEHNSLCKCDTDCYRDAHTLSLFKLVERIRKLAKTRLEDHHKRCIRHLFRQYCSILFANGASEDELDDKTGQVIDLIYFDIEMRPSEYIKNAPLVLCHVIETLCHVIETEECRFIGAMHQLQDAVIETQLVGTNDSQEQLTKSQEESTVEASQVQAPSVNEIGTDAFSKVENGVMEAICSENIACVDSESPRFMNNVWVGTGPIPVPTGSVVTQQQTVVKPEWFR